MNSEKSGLRLYYIPIIVAMALLASCSRPEHDSSGSSSADDTLAVVASDYRDDLYDQGHTNACWIYAMCACIEREQLRYGDSVALSRQWLMSHLLEEETIDYYLTHGIRNISMRGVGPDVLRLIHDYGLVPYNMERSCINNSSVMERKLKLLAVQSISLKELRSKTQKLLPEFTVTKQIPPTFYYYSMRYTPWQFAQSIMYDQQWRFFASEAIHPWHQPFVLEVADNYRYHQFMNVPMQEVYRMVVRSLKAGHPVYWEYGKVSREKNGGMATSDHAMAIVRYIPHCSLHAGEGSGDAFLCLNSYGKDWGRNGYCLVSKKFFMHHTCDVGLVSNIQ